MKDSKKQQIQDELRKRFPGAHVAYPRDPQKQSDIYKAIDALQRVWPGLDDATAEDIILNKIAP